jgi:glutathione S-transferase
VLLYNAPVSGDCYGVRLLLAQLGLEVETVDASVVDRSNRAELLGDLNPGLRVPTIVLDDGRPLVESNAILWYLGDGTDYVPSDPYAVRPGVAVVLLRAVITNWNTQLRPPPEAPAGRVPHAARADPPFLRTRSRPRSS